MSFNFSKKLAEYIWINGEFLKWEDANIHILTHSLHYSGAVFEGERAYNGVIFKLDQHTDRLLKSAEFMGLQHDYSHDQITKACVDTLERNSLKNAYIRPLIWRGAESLKVNSEEDIDINFLVLAVDSNPEFVKGLKLKVSQWRKFHPNTIPIQAKSSAHYAMSTVAQNTAAAEGFDDALLLDMEGNVAECTVSNIFFGKGNILVTPIADRFLNGITRQSIIEMAKRLGLSVEEKRISLDEISEYDCCFSTGTAREVAGIASINTGDKIINFKNEEMLSYIQLEFAKMVGKI
jgi:branched-chain amino acid aminotransferase